MKSLKDKLWMAIPFLLASLAVLSYFSINQNSFQYDATAIANGEIWRNISGHFAHWSFIHLFWDALAFLILGCICSFRSLKDFIFLILLSSLIISFSVEIFHPGMRCYRGLSGIDSALFCYAALNYIRDSIENKRGAFALAGSAAIVLICGKTIYEIATGSTLFVGSSNFIPLPIAHITGAIAGAMVFFSKFMKSEYSEENRSFA
jgi:rhomboid family GlyGly-CTERM serine protease